MVDGTDEVGWRVPVDRSGSPAAADHSRLGSASSYAAAARCSRWLCGRNFVRPRTLSANCGHIARRPERVDPTTLRSTRIYRSYVQRIDHGSRSVRIAFPAAEDDLNDSALENLGQRHLFGREGRDLVKIPQGRIPLRDDKHWTPKGRGRGRRVALLAAVCEPYRNCHAIRQEM